MVYLEVLAVLLRRMGLEQEDQERVTVLAHAADLHTALKDGFQHAIMRPATRLHL